MDEETPTPDLLDLKLLPAWVKESPNEKSYADFTGEESEPLRRPSRREEDRDRRRARGPRLAGSGRKSPRRVERAPRREEIPLPAVEVRFMPDPRALESVLSQIKAGHVAYSVFALARMFLDRPERYDVELKAKTGSLFQLGENGAVATDQSTLERVAFPNEKENFYRIEVSQSEPIKGNFTSVARCRLSGQLLGPTNHHGYQPQLRALYEQRFRRRMSFPEYQRQIEIVSDPAEIERWKEEARNVTTYITLREEPPLSFRNAAEAERHFRQNYLPQLVHSRAELTLDGVVSRRLPDRALGRAIEQAWAHETRSPSKMMQQLVGAVRAGGLHIFRHGKGFLFVSPIRPRPFGYEPGSVSAPLVAILEALAQNPRINRKTILEKLLAQDANGIGPEAREKKRLAFAADLHWLIGEGHVIEFNDGSLEIARAKQPDAKSEKPESASANPELPAAENSGAPIANENVAAPLLLEMGD